MRLEEYLIHLGEAWCAATGLSPVTLGAKLANDGKLFTRLAAGKGVTTTRWQSFLSFFRNGDNWPESVIPDAACDLLDRLENIATEADASTGQMSVMSRHSAQDEAA